ncbi:putative histidine kinase response regulator and transcription factor RR-A-type family [Lupinus albus]|uniref:histidine kinase n=3 Tax=Lupinus albus TaxID=3870 RepID=A0A6A4PHV3_LUPAL|nr:putative histidine kinase response regulator and transcription factor RR-A-type family [Lupinus albus]
MILLYEVGFVLKVRHLLLVQCCLLLSFLFLIWFISRGTMDTNMSFLGDGGGKMWLKWWEKIRGFGIHQHYYQYIGSKKVKRAMWKKLFVAWLVGWTMLSLCIFCCMSFQATEKRRETLASMCDERARMLQDQFNVSMNHIQALSILISTFHHAKSPSAIDQRTFARYTERTAFERPLTSGVAYAVRVLHSEREQFEKQQGWTIKRMDTVEEKQVHKDDYDPEKLEPSHIQEEYAPVIFAQDTLSHVISVDTLSGKEDRENVVRARESGKGVLTAPFRLLKTNRLGVILTFAVYSRDLPSNATPNERIQATNGYLGGVFDVESLVEKLLQQLASKQTVIVNVYDITNHTHHIPMYSSNVLGDTFYHVSTLNFGDPFRKHEMYCRFKQKPPWPWLSITTSIGILVIALLVGHIFYATVNRIAKVEDDCREMRELKKRAEAADVAKSQFLATVSHEIRTPMNGVLGMLHMLMDTDLDVTQQEFVRTAQVSGKALMSLINEVLDQAKIEAGKLELEAVLFDLRAILDDVLSLFSEKSQEKGVELGVYVSDQVPELLIGDPGRFRQIITNLMGNSIKFTDKGHVFVTVHLVEEVVYSTKVDKESTSENTLSGFPVADSRRSWEGFKAFSQEGPLGSFSSSSNDLISLIISVEDTGEGIPLEAQPRIFTPFMKVGPSISRKHGGTGIGLSISKYLVRLMNGEIGFVSKPKVGSTFTFITVFANGLPSSNECKTQQIINQPHLASSEFEGMTAMIIDHRPVRAKVSRYHIQRLGIHVEMVSDFNQGLSALTNENMVINMVLIEQEVWDKDSGMSSHFVNNIGKIVHVIPPKMFILVNSSSSSRAMTVTSGVHNPAVITKPLRASMLAASLQHAMGVRNKGTPRNGDLPSLSLRHLFRGRRILIVDDNSVNRMVAAATLKKYGAEVVCVSSGKEAISSLKPPHQFDACFMDIQMPEMDGFEATRTIRDMELSTNNEVSVDDFDNVSNWHVPIVAMTADVIQATQEECLKCGMDGYVSKPFEVEQLYREVSWVFQSS